MLFMHFMYNMLIMSFKHSFRGMHDCLVPVTPYMACIFKNLRSKQKLPPRIRAMDMRHSLLLLPFLLEGLLTEEVAEYNRRNPIIKVSDPSPHMVQIVMMLLAWYGLYRRRFPAKDEDDLEDLDQQGLRYKLHIMSRYIRLLTYISRFLSRCEELFPYKNKRGDLITDTEKMHSIRHAGNDIARWGDTVNTNTEAPETGHKKWVKGQGGKTNQGPAANLSMMIHTVRKAASALCCDGVQGRIMFTYMTYIA